MSPTQRTLKRCREFGWFADVVERYNHHTRRRYDWMGWGDILAVDCHGVAYMIQATSGAHHRHRVRKLQEECADAVRAWCRGSNVAEVWSWSQRVWLRKDGTKAKRRRWECRVERVEV